MQVGEYMEKKIMRFLKELNNTNKKRFNVFELEGYVINSYKGNSLYQQNGGYTQFAKEINKLMENNCIKEIKSSPYNGLNPPLKLRWELAFKEESSIWDKSNILKLSDCLDFTYYVKNPKYQTPLEWEYIENIYRFIKSREHREWASVEERSLELFYDEKFLINRGDTPKGKYGILSRLNLTYDDLKMIKYGEMFIYWNRGTKDIKKIIILENHSTFFSYKRIAELNKSIFGTYPDLLIFGEGKKIESSFSFIEEIVNIEDIEVLYFGDIDPEGLGIYIRLKERYPNVNIRLQHNAYIELISVSNRYYPLNGQRKEQLFLDKFLEEIGEYLEEKDLRKLKYIWDNDFRIPQELINYEYLLKVIE